MLLKYRLGREVPQWGPLNSYLSVRSVAKSVPKEGWSDVAFTMKWEGNDVKEEKFATPHSNKKCDSRKEEKVTGNPPQP